MKGKSADYCRSIGKLGGRPRGKRDKATLHKEKVLDKYRQLVMHDAERLFYSQSTIAHGQTFLFRIDKIKMGKNRYINDKPKLVDNPYEMMAYLDGLAERANGNIEDTNDPAASYYFLTAKEPSNMAIDSMLDRALGKARQVVGLEGSTPGSAIVVQLEDTQYDRIIQSEFERIVAEQSALAGAEERAREEGSA